MRFPTHSIWRVIEFRLFFFLRRKQNEKNNRPMKTNKQMPSLSLSLSSRAINAYRILEKKIEIDSFLSSSSLISWNVSGMDFRGFFFFLLGFSILMGLTRV